MKQEVKNMSIKEKFGKKSRRYELIICSVIVVLLTVAIIISIKTDFIYKTNFFNVPTKKMPQITTVCNKYTSDELDINVKSNGSNDSFMTVNFTIEKEINSEADINNSDIVMVKYTTGGNCRESVYYPVETIFEKEITNGKNTEKTNYELQFFVPAESFESEKILYSLRIDTNSDIGIINVVYNI